MNSMKLSLIATICDKHRPGESFIAGADHDVIFLNLSEDDVTEDSEDGKVLEQAGASLSRDDYDCWVIYV